MFFAIVLLASLSWAAYGLQNVTIDDTNSAIVYTGNWQLSKPSRFDFGPAPATHRLSMDATARATFTFTGVGVYFMSPRWPYPVTTLITLDSGIPDRLDLMDHTPNVQGEEETVQSQVVWGRGGLTNTVHTLVASMANMPEDKFVVVDGFIYTALDPSDNATSTSISPTSSASTSSSSQASSTSRAVAPPATSSAAGTGTSPNRTLAIALGGVFGAVGIAVVVAALLLCRRRHTPSTPGSTSGTRDSTVYPAGQSQNQMDAAHSSPVNSAYFSQPYSSSNQPYVAAAQGFDSTNSPRNAHYAHPTMAAAASPAPLSNRYTETNRDIYAQQPIYDHWQAATPRSNDPMAGRGPYQVNTLSTITETSVGPYPGTTTTTRPGSEFGYQGPLEGSDRMSSVASGSRPTSSYVPSQQQREKELVSGKSQEFSPVSEKAPGQPPSYLP